MHGKALWGCGAGAGSSGLRPAPPECLNMFQLLCIYWIIRNIGPPKIQLLAIYLIIVQKKCSTPLEHGGTSGTFWDLSTIGGLLYKFSEHLGTLGDI